jgi:hypothetical protein
MVAKLVNLSVDLASETRGTRKALAEGYVKQGMRPMLAACSPHTLPFIMHE